MKVSTPAVPLLVLLPLLAQAQDTVPGLAAWQAAIAAHEVAENNLAEQESREEAVRQQESGEGKEPEARTDSKSGKGKASKNGAFRDILKSAVNKLLTNIGNKKKSSSTSSPTPTSSSQSFLDKLLIDLDKDKDIDFLTSGLQTTETSSSSESSLDELIRSLTRNRKKDSISPRRIKNNRHKLATSASYLDKILNRQTDRERDFISRRRLAQSELERLLDDDFYDYEERPRSRFLLDDYYDDNLRLGGGRLRQAMRASRRLGNDLDYLLDRLQRRN